MTDGQILLVIAAASLAGALLGAIVNVLRRP